MKKIAILIAVLTMFFGCGENKKSTPMKRNITGKAGEMVVVMSENYWSADAGNALRDLLTAEVPGLPQSEPLFDIIQIPKEGYGDIFKTSRNIVFCTINPSISKSGIVFKSDKHAFLQATLSIEAKSQNEFIQIINDNASKIEGYFLGAERKRLKHNYSNYNLKSISTATKDAFGFSIYAPPGWEVSESRDNFMWLLFRTNAIDQGLFIYSFPYESDSTFTSNYLIRKRNLVLRDNVPGPIDGSYMSTAMDLPVNIYPTKISSNYATEIRGLWRVENDFMGGPFIQLAVLDMLKNRVVVLDGYVYAPSKDKRNFIRQLEAIIYSFEFENQEDIDKINQQYNL